MRLQFEALMEDGLYHSLSRQAVALAPMKMRDGLKALGLDFLIDSPSNQQFPILPDAGARRKFARKRELQCDRAASGRPDRHPALHKLGDGGSGN